MPSNDPSYQKKYIKQHYQDNKQYYLSKSKERNKRIRTYLYSFVDRYKLYVGCVDCGYNRNPKALQFDHVRDTKTLAVSSLINRAVSLKRLKEEIRKCDVRCAHCHAIVTFERRLSS